MIKSLSRPHGMTLVEVLASITIFALAILLVGAGLTAISRAQQLNAAKAQAATLAMALGQYRAADMIVMSARRLGGTYPVPASTATDLAKLLTPLSPVSATAVGDYWNSISYQNTSGATFHGAVLTSTSVTPPAAKAGAVGDSWLDRCGLFLPYDNYCYTDPAAGFGNPPSAVLVKFSVKDSFFNINPPVFSNPTNPATSKFSSYGYLKLSGGSQVDWNFNRIYLVNPNYSTAFSLDNYGSIAVTFSQPDDQPSTLESPWPGDIYIKARFLAATFWWIPTGTVLASYNDAYGRPRLTGGPAASFLGRYLILDSLDP